MTELNLDNPQIIALLSLLTLLAGLVRGFTGFGGPAVMILVLVPFYSPLSVLPKVAMVDLIANFKLIPSTVREVNWPIVVTIVVASLVAAPIGVYALNATDAVAMRRAVALIAIVCTCIMLTGWRFKRSPPLWSFALAGVVAGFVLGATYIAFVMVMFIMAGPASAAISRATAIFWGFVLGLLIVGMHMAMGNVSWSDMWRSGLLGLVYLFGTSIGARWFRQVSEVDFRKTVLWFLLLLGCAGLFA